MPLMHLLVAKSTKTQQSTTTTYTTNSTFGGFEEVGCGGFAIVLQQSTCYGVSELGNLLLLL